MGNQQPVFDVTCNWELIDAWENKTHTHLEFSRLLNTCDKQDVVIQVKLESSDEFACMIGLGPLIKSLNSLFSERHKLSNLVNR